MSLMDVLKKIGKTAKTIFSVAPGILVLFGVPPVLIPVLQAAMADAEGIPGATGLEKKAHVLAIVNDSVITHNQLHPSAPIDQGVALEAASKAIDATIASVKIVHEHQAASDSPTVPTVPPTSFRV